MADNHLDMNWEDLLVWYKSCCSMLISRKFFSLIKVISERRANKEVDQFYDLA